MTVIRAARGRILGGRTFVGGSHPESVDWKGYSWNRLEQYGGIATRPPAPRPGHRSRLGIALSSTVGLRRHIRVEGRGHLLEAHLGIALSSTVGLRRG